MPDHLVIDASDVLLHLNPVTTNGHTYSLVKEGTIAVTVTSESKGNNWFWLKKLTTEHLVYLKSNLTGKIFVVHVYQLLSSSMITSTGFKCNCH